MSRGMSEFERLTTYTQEYKTKSKYKVCTSGILILQNFLSIQCISIRILHETSNFQSSTLNLGYSTSCGMHYFVIRLTC